MDVIKRLHEQQERRRLSYGLGAEAFSEALREAQAKRAKKYGIAPKEGGNLTPPKGYPQDEASYGDPSNFRWPADAEHAPAVSPYFNRADAREKGGYSAREWAVVGQRLARLLTRHMRGKFVYRAERLEREEEK